LITLMYHRVLDTADPTLPNPSLISATPDVFEWQVRYLARRHAVVSLTQVLDAVRGGARLPERAILITFDDAYRDFGEVAWPILRRHGLPATVFVPTGYPGRAERVFWWERLSRAFGSCGRPSVLRLPWRTLVIQDDAGRRAAMREIQECVKRLPHPQGMALVDEVLEQLRGELEDASSPGPADREPPLVLGWRELRELAREGVTLCAHTRMHAALSQLPLDEAAEEIRGSLEDLRSMIGVTPPAFAYPFGDHDPAVVELLRSEGVEIGFTTEEGHAHLPADDPLRLPRTSMSARSARLLPARLGRAGESLDRWRRRRRSPAWRETRMPGASPGPLEGGSPGVVPPAEATSTSGSTAGTARPVAYVMSRFPKLTETFVLYEIAALEAMGVPVEVFPLLRERQAVAHPEAESLARRAHFHPFVSLPVIAAHLHFIRESPSRYSGTLLEVLRRTWGSRNFFVGALGTFPKAVRFALEMKRLGVRHVHAHFANHPTVAAFIVHRLTGIPYSFTAHGHDLHVERRMLDAKVGASAFTVTVSAYNRELIERECGDAALGKVHVVHCGVDPEVFSGGLALDRAPAIVPAEGSSGVPRRPFTIACVASFEEVKGHAHLVEACGLLRDRGVDVRCHLVGDGPLREEVEAAAARAGVRDRIVFHGALPRRQVARLLSLADAAVLASRPTREGKREGIPVALMEAMAVGLPVVASRLSGIPELVDDGRCGLLVPPADAEALAGALERLAASPELRRTLGRAARERVLDDFDLRKNARKLLDLVMENAAAAKSDAAAPSLPATEAPSVPPRRMAEDSARRPERGRRASAV
jgi:glycosyltransferase involved in cell wall biosynthesis/peptidoglycan/xylan/chitin deacetylase (PgdA/CDA1 family)